ISGRSRAGEARALSAPLVRVRDVLLRERDVRLPFRFGAVTLTEATEAFARVRVTLKDGRSAWGQAAEMLAPKWFDKDPARSNADNAAAGVATAAETDWASMREMASSRDRHGRRDPALDHGGLHADGRGQRGRLSRLLWAGHLPLG